MVDPMQKYQFKISLVVDDAKQYMQNMVHQKSFYLPETQFIAVTSYQNEQV